MEIGTSVVVATSDRPAIEGQALRVVVGTADLAKRSLVETARDVVAGARSRRKIRRGLGGPADMGAAHWSPADLIGPALGRNAKTWEALERLGVEPGTELPVSFCFESGGIAGDRRLAGFLERELGFAVVVEPEGVSGRTPPLVLSPETLDEWVETMVNAGFAIGGCRFAGWTVTVDRRSRTAPDCPELDVSSDRKTSDNGSVIS